MVKPLQFERGKPFSLLEEKRLEDEYAKLSERVDFLTATTAAFAEDNAMSWVFNQLEEYDIDPDFELTDERYEELTKDIPLEFRDFTEDVRSMQHGYKLKDRVQQSLKNEETLSRYGWAGLPLRIAAATIDPVAVGATILSEGVLAPAIWANKVSRLQRAFRGALTAGGTSAAIEGYLVSQNEIKDPYDILYAAAGGFILGGATGSIFGKKSTDYYENAANNLASTANAAQVSDVTQAMTDQGIQGLTPTRNPLAESIRTQSENDLELINGIDSNEIVPQDKTFLPLFDMTGQVMKSPIAGSRKLMQILGENAKDPGPFTADLIKTTDAKAITARFARLYNEDYKKWAKSTNINLAGRTFYKDRNTFGELIADEVENPGSSTNPHIISSANIFRKEMSFMLNEGKRADLFGFDNIPENPRYFSHLWDGAKISDLNHLYGAENVIKVLQLGLSRANPEMSEEIAQEIAKKMSEKIVRSSFGIDAGLSRLFSTSQRDVLKQVLEEEELLSAEKIESLLNQIHTKPQKGIPRTRRRLKFDVNAKILLDDGTELSVKDMMNRNAEDVFNIYVNQVVGRTALAKVGIKSDSDFKKRIEDILQEGSKEGNIAQAKADVEKLQVLYDIISGRPSPKVGDPTALGNRLARLLLDYSFIRVMNQVGFAQVAELGNAVSIDGVTGLIRVLPEFKSMLKRVRNGELEDSVANDIEAFTGVGADRLIHNSVNRHDPVDIISQGRGGTGLTGFFSRAIDSGVNLIQPLKRITADISLMAQVTLALERAAARIATQQLVDLSFGIQSINFARLGRGTRQQDIARRMRSLGLNESMSQRVFEQIRRNAVLGPSFFFGNSRKVRRINLSNWNDTQARDAFRYAISRWARQSIQQNDVGNLNIHMTGTLGKILTQFRTFMLVSYSKQFLHNINRRDFAAFQGMMYSMLFGGLAYTLQTHVNSLGRSDKTKFLEERLSIEEIAKASFQRAGWASIFPPIMDTANLIRGEDPMFSYGRSTGLPSNLVKGIPLFDLADNVAVAGIGGIRHVFNDDYRWSRGQMRAFNSLVPFQNAMGIKNVLNKTLEGLPTNSKLTY